MSGVLAVQSSTLGYGIAIIAIIFFLLMILISAVSIMKVMHQHKQDSSSPKVQVDAKVVEKKIERSRSISKTYGFTTYMTYYVTFLIADSMPMRFVVLSEEYEWLQEGDCGKLSYQGTRYIGFSKKS